ncbi:SpoIIE family protein phosphatase [Desulfitobacterium sp. Sab5]|uniref:SpoIIE family protein phosphatase n=1 Tax=Desulfitobacterium TaxID=36853 RepID=UPI003CE7EFFE
MNEEIHRKLVNLTFKKDYCSDTLIEIAGRVFEASQESICMTNPNGKITYVNPAFTRTTGYFPEDILGKNPRILQSGRHKVAFYRSMWKDLIEKGQWQGEIWNKRKNGQIFPEWMSIHAVYDEASMLTNYVAIFRDITEDMEMRREVELAGRIQKGLLMPDFNKDELMLKSLYFPYTHLSGDYYDYRWNEAKKNLRGFLFDVMGHGIATALQVSALRVLYRQVMEKELSLPEKMKWLNNECISILPDDFFAGGILFHIDLVKRQIHFVMAGINHFLLCSGKGLGLKVVSKPGLFLGISEDEEFEEHECSFEPGDGAIFLTDGFFDRIQEKNLALDKMNVSSMMNLLNSPSFTQELLDDATALGFMRPREGD